MKAATKRTLRRFELARLVLNAIAVCSLLWLQSHQWEVSSGDSFHEAAVRYAWQTSSVDIGALLIDLFMLNMLSTIVEVGVLWLCPPNDSSEAQVQSDRLSFWAIAPSWGQKARTAQSPRI
jgi:hypothetical protein